MRVKYAAFIEEEADWLEGFAMYSVLKERFGGVAWTDWPVEFSQREASALEQAKRELDLELKRVRFQQFFLREQWNDVRAVASRLNLRIVGDLPIFVAHDSADVWCERALFRLKEDGYPLVMAGVPPDYFSRQGNFGETRFILGMCTARMVLPGGVSVCVRFWTGWTSFEWILSRL